MNHRCALSALPFLHCALCNLRALKHGDGVTISGLNFGAGTGFGRGNITNVTIGGAFAPFQIVGLTQIKALVPTNAVIGPVTVANEAGSFTSFETFQAAALISRVVPAKGRPGDAIEVQGRNLDATARAEFEAVPARFTVVSRTNILVFVPTNVVNSRLVLTSPAGSVSTTNRIVVEPRIFRFSPNFGAAGTSVTLDGGGFHGLTDVRFGTIQASIVSRSQTTVQVLAPNGAPNGPITLTTTNGTFTTPETFQFPARLNSFSPGFGRRGDVVSLEGAYLDGVSAVRFNGVEATFTNVSPARINAVVPALATSGRISLVTRAGEIATTSDFAVRPVLDGFSPLTGTVGTAVILSGAGLTNLAWVRLGGLDATFNVLDSTRVRAVVPVGAYSGPFRIRTVEANEVEAPGNFFVDGARPTITSFSPTNGASGTRVTVNGQGFRTLSKVQFNGANAEFQLVSPTQFTTTVPQGASTGPIAVTTLDGVGFSVRDFQYTEVPVLLRAQWSAGLLVLRWSGAALGYRLETADAPGTQAGAEWTEVDEIPVRTGADWQVTLDPTSSPGGHYFRLRK